MRAISPHRKTYNISVILSAKSNDDIVKKKGITYFPTFSFPLLKNTKVKTYGLLNMSESKP